MAQRSRRRTRHQRELIVIEHPDNLDTPERVDAFAGKCADVLLQLAQRERALLGLPRLR
jgi:hypothetical protein